MKDSLASGSTDLRQRFPLPTGTRLDHYVIDDVLGAGGFGITYLAEHSVLGKKYAIKEYFPQSLSYREGNTVRPTSSSGPTYNWGLERFVTEARALARFKHPAIVDVASIFEANGTAYIVLGYESGGDLSAWVRRLGRAPTQEELDRLLMPLLSALEEIHKRNLLHRDIAPDNLLIREDGTPVLIDFGSARESVRNRSQAVSAIVKHGYSPPEQYSSRADLQGPWTDIYALAATIYRAVTGLTPVEATERMMEDRVQRIARSVRGTYRESFLDAIDWGLRLRPEERPQTVADWREKLFRGTGIEFERPVSEPSRGVQSDTGVPPSSPPSARPLTDGSVRPAPGKFSQRITRSQRPDLSVLDAPDIAPEAEASTVDTVAAQQSRKIQYGIAGLAGGATGGALFAILLASIFSSSCFADSCVMSYLAPCTLLGAVVGIVGGVYFAGMANSAETPGNSERF